MRGHGATIVGRTVSQAVLFAVYAVVNARILTQAFQIGGNPIYLNATEGAKIANILSDGERTWHYFESLVELKYVDRERGLVSREIFVDEEVYRLEQERIFCTQWLFIGHAQPNSECGRLLCLANGRRERHHGARKRRPGTRAPEFVPSSRHESLPLRRGQHADFHLSVSRLELRFERRPGRRAALQGRLSR